MKQKLLFRKAQIEDISSISEIYEDIHTEIEQKRAFSGWIRGIYPTTETASDSIEKHEMFVAETDGKIVAAAKINHYHDL